MATTETFKLSDRLTRVAGDAVACPASGDTVVSTIAINGQTRLCYHFAVATQNVDNFDVLVKAHPTATAVDITPADWTDVSGTARFQFSSGNLAAVAAAGTGYFEMDVTGLSEVVVEVSGAVNNASVTPYYTLQ
jgi:hypothetical protein